MKKIINHPDHVVTEMLEGIALAHPEVVYFKEAEVIARKEKSIKVGLVSGGGSGHEPSHAGYVGKGMLDAAVAGNVFASPSPDRVLKGIQEANGGKGVLLIIKNYSGDIMNFQMAQELAEMEGIEVDHVVVKDDVAVPDSTYSTGRRGIAGTVFVHKVAGAKAETGASLQEVKQVAEKTIANIRSMGMAMSSCVLPGVGTPSFTLGADEIEIGMGIHGEPGIEKSPVLPAKEIAKKLVEPILNDFEKMSGEVAVMVNGLGATPLMELYILFKEVTELLKQHDISIYRAYVGNFMTALEMSGASLTLLNLDEELKALLDAPCQTPAMKG
ncbi:dihydroxyacetone kinase subunit DhaK [Anoxynatronum buryatiense]|uniref:Dihydroxyacetone kinase DhaK subunit n=1 Tax=Anoxynatronum buryatiense TaxID=489973 RepID=A0AA45WW40_9CLOT|nr:dihydroxyacetone kinase subunit DhaK [Anoxynatronum buryatiense]SMP56217.1 dihydroxyacetone kinase DhaK subunit [Anoxynatronum buryatiense]